MQLYVSYTGMDYDIEIYLDERIKNINVIAIEDFEHCITGAFPQGWVNEIGGGGIQVEDRGGNPYNKALHISTSNQIQLSNSFFSPEYTGKVLLISFKTAISIPNDDTGYVAITFGLSEYQLELQFVPNGDELSLRFAEGMRIIDTFCSIEYGVSHKFDIVMENNIEGWNYLNIYIDGVCQYSHRDIYSDNYPYFVSGVMIYALYTGNKYMYFDDLFMGLLELHYSENTQHLIDPIQYLYAPEPLNDGEGGSPPVDMKFGLAHYEQSQVSLGLDFGIDYKGIGISGL